LGNLGTLYQALCLPSAPNLTTEKRFRNLAPLSPGPLELWPLGESEREEREEREEGEEREEREERERSRARVRLMVQGAGILPRLRRAALHHGGNAVRADCRNPRPSLAPDCEKP
jgi:hypothetical protein